MRKLCKVTDETIWALRQLKIAILAMFTTKTLATRTFHKHRGFRFRFVVTLAADAPAAQLARLEMC
jgi:hypothetical protein